MRKPQQSGMEEKLLAGPTPAIEPVADNRASQTQGVTGMKPELMRPSGQGRECHQGLAVPQLQFSPPADPLLALDRIIHLVGSVFRIEPEAQGDFSIAANHCPFEQGEIPFLHPPLRELAGQVCMRAPGQSQHHQA